MGNAVEEWENECCMDSIRMLRTAFEWYDRMLHGQHSNAMDSIRMVRSNATWTAFERYGRMLWSAFECYGRMPWPVVYLD